MMLKKIVLITTCILLNFGHFLTDKKQSINFLFTCQ